MSSHKAQMLELLRHLSLELLNRRSAARSLTEWRSRDAEYYEGKADGLEQAWALLAEARVEVAGWL